MRIVYLDDASRKNLLEDLLKRSPNQYGEYEQKGIRRYLPLQKDLMGQK